MTRAQSEASRKRYQREALEICPACDGTGIAVGLSARLKARKGGINSFLRSLQAGQLSMAERGTRGGRPKEPTIADVIDGGRGMGCP